MITSLADPFSRFRLETLLSKTGPVLMCGTSVREGVRGSSEIREPELRIAGG